MNLRVILAMFQNFLDFPSTHLEEMICTNMNKRSIKVIYFAISMDYSVYPVQVLIERFSRKLINQCFAIVDNDKFWSTIRFSKNFCSICFSFINGCVIENILCSDVICSRIAISGDPPDGSLAVGAYKKILFFSTFLFPSHGKGETNEPLASKSKAPHCETKW